MPEANDGRTEARPFVSLASNSGASVEPEQSEQIDEGTEDTEIAAGKDAESEAGDEGEEAPEPPTAEELGLAEDSPEYRAAYKKLMAQWGKWTNRFAAKRKSAPAKAEPEPDRETATESAATGRTAAAGDSDPFDELYRVDFDSFKPDVKGREASDLGEYRDEIVEIATAVARQMVEHTLQGVRSNDVSFRKRAEASSRDAKAYSVISDYISSIEEHPEFADKEKAIAEFAVKTKAFAIEDPEEWVDTVERKFGLVRDWRSEKEGQRALRVAADRRTSQKLRSIVQRPTAGARLNGAPRGDMKFDDALDSALRGFGR